MINKQKKKFTTTTEKILLRLAQSSLFFQRRSHPNRNPQRRLKGSYVCNPFTGYIMGGSVSRGSYGDWKTAGDRHSAIEPQEFGGDLPLIVVHSHDPEKFPLTSPDKDGIRRERSQDIHPFLSRSFYRRLNDILFFRTEEAFFSGVGI